MKTNLRQDRRLELDFRREKFTKRKPQMRTTSSATKPVIVLLLATLLLPDLQPPGNLPEVRLISAQQPQQPPGSSEYLLVGQAGQRAHLPCLIGRQLYCGEPYFIAWYKRNSSSSRDWTRIEYLSPAAVDGDDLGGVRARFAWVPRQSPAELSPSGSCEQLAAASNLSPQVRLKLETNFDCAQLTIDRLELRDEGQYKCEITFSESLDIERCPATTLSQLSVIGE